VLFTEPLFFAFFAIVAIVYWSSSQNHWRKRWLTAASYFFYAAWDWRFCSLILLSTVIDFVVGLKLENSPTQLLRHRWRTVRHSSFVTAGCS
jgi:D-alanyl-lipoteichoic acid acyltransferase DltB (MBOAT superfamily)